MHRWPILHQETFEDVDMTEHGMAPTEEPGSGPFEATSWNKGNTMEMAPHDGHPVYSPDHNLLFVGYAQEQPMLRALDEGEIDVAPFRSFVGYRRMRDEMEEVTAVTTDGFLPFAAYFQVHMPPFNFSDLRHAVGMAIDRTEINTKVFGGEAMEPTHGIHLMSNHPFFPEEDLPTYVDDPSGDMEGARALLEENGWSWDDNGNLHYPEEVDPEPAFPIGGQPDPANYECLDSDGNYIPPEER
jgi:peptide/nickel transport system substrate-binding protein